jgi:hypothetical protein
MSDQALCDFLLERDQALCDVHVKERVATLANHVHKLMLEASERAEIHRKPLFPDRLHQKMIRQETKVYYYSYNNIIKLL